MKDWSYFDRFEETNDRYLPPMGQGDTLATQTVTAVTKLIYKWYNDGDVYDNVNSPLSGWLNDLSSYANWLWNQFPDAQDILARIAKCYTDGDYEDLLADLADLLLDMDRLDGLNNLPAAGDIYHAEGPFEFSDDWDGEDGYDEEDDYTPDDDDYDEEGEW